MRKKNDMIKHPWFVLLMQNEYNITGAYKYQNWGNTSHTYYQNETTKKNWSLEPQGINRATHPPRSSLRTSGISLPRSRARHQTTSWWFMAASSPSMSPWPRKNPLPTGDRINSHGGFRQPASSQGLFWHLEAIGPSRPNRERLLPPPGARTQLRKELPKQDQ